MAMGWPLKRFSKTFDSKDHPWKRQILGLRSVVRFTVSSIWAGPQACLLRYRGNRVVVVVAVVTLHEAPGVDACRSCVIKP